MAGLVVLRLYCCRRLLPVLAAPAVLAARPPPSLLTLLLTVMEDSQKNCQESKFSLESGEKEIDSCLLGYLKLRDQLFSTLTQYVELGELLATFKKKLDVNPKVFSHLESDSNSPSSDDQFFKNFYAVIKSVMRKRLIEIEDEVHSGAEEENSLPSSLTSTQSVPDILPASSTTTQPPSPTKAADCGPIPVLSSVTQKSTPLEKKVEKEKIKLPKRGRVSWGKTTLSTLGTKNTDKKTGWKTGRIKRIGRKN